MKFALVSALAAAAAVQATPTATQKQPPTKRALTAITASGNAFWKGNERFYVRGVDYQPGAASGMVDPLADKDICMRDIKEFKNLGINTIRVYTTDNSADHKECMDALADAGIYAILDLNNPLYSINRANPHPSYNEVYLQSIFATIDEFSKYDNTMAFFSGNEVIHDEKNTTLSAPYVKAVTRDARAYMKARSIRAIPVGYSAADVSQNRMETADYFNCGADSDRSDFFAMNDYSWCSSDFETAGWDVKVKNFTGYGIPLFLSEYGCNANKRDFGEIEALMSDKMSGVYSGGLMYEYTQEEADYGIVSLTNPKAAAVSTLDEYDAFKTAMSKYPAPTGDGGFTSTTNSRPCPTSNDNWAVSDTRLPAMPAGASAYFTNGAGSGPGLKGDGSQWATGTSTGYADGSSMDSTATGGASGDGENAAGSLQMSWTPFVLTGATFAFTMVGTLLL